MTDNRHTRNWRQRPGQGPKDFVLEPLEGEVLLAQVRFLINSKIFAGTDLIFHLHKSLGFPRAWQLDGVGELENLSPEYKDAFRVAVTAILAEAKPGEKYMLIYDWMMAPTLEEGFFDDVDLTNEELTEKKHWLFAMPIAFLERIASLK